MVEFEIVYKNSNVKFKYHTVFISSMSVRDCPFALKPFCRIYSFGMKFHDTILVIFRLNILH